MSDNVFIIISITILLFGILLAAYDVHNRTSYREQSVEKFGCEYLGTARDMPSVAFFNCNGEIKLKPISELN